MDRNSKEFKELQKTWYKKLEKTGFDDAEAGEKTLKAYHSMRWVTSRWDKDKIEAITDYYRLAGQFLHEYKFESKKEAKIWEYHAEGLAIADIEKLMRTRRFKVYRDMINKTIMRLRQKMLELYE